MSGRLACYLSLSILLGLVPSFSFGLEWQQRDNYRIASLVVPLTGKAGFTLMTNQQHGILFTNDLPLSRAKVNNNLLNGAGVAAGDFDGDGLCDLYFCNLDGTNALYRNLGNWQFQDVTASAGTGCPGQSSTGAVFADVNGDGRLDLLVCSCGGPVSCFINLGNGQFTNMTSMSGLRKGFGATSMALADIDGDGDLDLYVANYAKLSLLRSGGAIAMRNVNGKQVITGPGSERLRILDGKLVELGEPDILYLNDGKGHFSAVSWTNGAFLDEMGRPLKEAPQELGLSAMFRDINGDGAPDLYVCNDYEAPDRIWINNGKGHFRALPMPSMRSSSRFSMSVDFADINRDGYDDFIVADMLSRSHLLKTTQSGVLDPDLRHPGRYADRPQIRRNTLFLNRGNGTFSEIANYAGLTASDWTWCVAFMDVDLDGFEDLLVANGHAFDIQDFDTMERNQRLGRPQSAEDARERLLLFPSLRTPNYAFRNQGDFTFTETGTSWGFNSTEVSHGLILADLDNDGDMDVVINCLNAPPLLYRNDSDRPRIAVRLEGALPNTKGIGATIKVTGFGLPQTQQILAGGRYLSSDQPMRMFAAGSLTNELTVQVTWRSGRQTTIEHMPANSYVEVQENSAIAPQATPKPKPLPLFADVSSLINHHHHENDFAEFQRQPLLPKMLSQPGPGLAWYDLNGSGHDDLIISSGAGGNLAVYHNLGNGKFELITNEVAQAKTSRDQTSVLGWTPAPGQRELLVGMSNYEDGKTNGPAVLRLDWNSGKPITMGSIPATASSAGPLALADIDGDGDLDVFIGGRAIPGRYPEAASSRLLRNQNGKLIEGLEDNLPFSNIGLVSGAVFSDLDNDGFPELILACEWGPIRVFKNSHGKFSEISKKLGLDQYTGWWNGVATGDFDEDGKTDIVAANWGLNSAYRATVQEPLQMYYEDFDQDGFMDLLESEYEHGSAFPRRDLFVLGTVFPSLRQQFTTHRAFGEATLPQIIKAMAWHTKTVEATTLSSMIFLNRGASWQAVRLPAEAQFAPAFCPCVADFDGDGHQDIFLSQNCFALPPDMPRIDAGQGLLLKGDGHGEFKAVAALESGLVIHGEQRGATFADYDEDGRVDLAVTQNGAQTRLFRNEQASPGIRVRLKGPPGNPSGIGAQLRMKTGSNYGPALEIQSGSGYLSQNSSIAILPPMKSPSTIEVRWPGGTITRTTVIAGLKLVEISFEGN
jgi:hypothetical protein